MKWTPDLIIAFTLIIACIILIALNIDSEVKSILTVSSGWVFGTQIQAYRARRNHNAVKGGEK